jgi:hypothetical protein
LVVLRIEQLDALLVEVGVADRERRRVFCESYLWSLAGGLFDERIDIETTAGGVAHLVAHPIQFEPAAEQSPFACDVRHNSGVAIYRYFES